MIKRKIRVLAINASDNDGTHAGNATAVAVQARLETATQIYSNAKIEFEFDPASDFLSIKNTLLNRSVTIFDDPTQYASESSPPASNTSIHDEARERFAKLFKGRLCVFFRYRNELYYDKDSGHWAERQRSFGSSGWGAWYVNMGSIGDSTSLAHEIGHYLQIRHPFVGGIVTVADAAERIRAYVEDHNHPADEGLNALDGDRTWVLDTPADAAGSIFEDVYGVGNKCGPDGTIDIPVDFNSPNLPSRTYTLAPDRSLIMSYFKDCPGDKSISSQEAIRVRDGLEQGLKHNLISLNARGLSGSITKGASAEAGGIGALDMAYITEGRVVTAVRTREKKLKLISWDINSTGSSITRKGDAQAGVIEHGTGLSCCSLGLGLVSTAVGDSNGNLKVIIWQVANNGQIYRKQSAGAGGILGVASCRVGISWLATGVRMGNGKFRVIIWEVTADGSIERKAFASAGAVGKLSMCAVDSQHFVTHLQDSGGNLKTILWKYDSAANKVVRCDEVQAGKVSKISSTTLNRKTVVSTLQDGGNNLRLIAWNASLSCDQLERAGDAAAGGISAVSACSMGVDLVVAAMRDRENMLRVILYEIGANGELMLRKGTGVSSVINEVKTCRAGHQTFATACKDGNNNFLIVAWKIG